MERPSVEIEYMEIASDLDAPEAGLHVHRSMPAAIGVGLLALLALLATSTMTSTDSATPPTSTALAPTHSTTASVVESTVPPLPVAEGSGIPGLADERLHLLHAASARPGRSEAVVVFTATPSNRRTAPPFMHVVRNGLATTTQLEGSVWLEEPSLEWPGEVLSPFVRTERHAVYPSAGSIWSQDLYSGDVRRIGEGIRVLPGTMEDEVWIVGSGTRTLTVVDLTTGELEEHDAPPGFPLAAFGDGLLLRTLDGGRRGYATWTPGSEPTPLGVKPTVEFLGGGGDRALFTDGAALTVHNRLTGRTSSVRLPDDVGLRRAAVSPDGLLVALADRPDIVSFSEVHIVKVDTGAVVDSFRQAVDLQLSFVDARTIQYVGPGTETGWDVVHRDVLAREGWTIASAQTPMLWFSAIVAP